MGTHKIITLTMRSPANFASTLMVPTRRSFEQTSGKRTPGSWKMCTGNPHFFIAKECDHQIPQQQGAFPSSTSTKEALLATSIEVHRSSPFQQSKVGEPAEDEGTSSSWSA